MKPTAMIPHVRRIALALCAVGLLAALQGCIVTTENTSAPAGNAAAATPMSSPTSALQLVPTFTPASRPVPVVTAHTHLRQGPGTRFPTMGWLTAGTPVQIAARSADGMWLRLASGHWIAAQSVNHTPPALPVATASVPTPSP